MTTHWITLTGYAALDYAAERGITLRKHADPTEGARDGVSLAEAREICAQDPSLIWLERPARDGELEPPAREDEPKPAKPKPIDVHARMLKALRSALAALQRDSWESDQEAITEASEAIRIAEGRLREGESIDRARAIARCYLDAPEYTREERMLNSAIDAACGEDLDRAAALVETITEERWDARQEGGRA